MPKKGFQLNKGFSTRSISSTRRLSRADKGKGVAKEEKGKGIARSRDLEMPEDILRSSSLDPMERDLVLDMLSDEYGCDWVSASRAAQALVAAKAMMGKIFVKTHESREQLQDDLDDSDTAVLKSSQGESSWIGNIITAFRLVLRSSASVELCGAPVLEFVGAVPKENGEVFSSSCAALESKESLHTLPAGFGAVVEHEKLGEVGKGMWAPYTMTRSTPIY